MREKRRFPIFYTWDDVADVELEIEARQMVAFAINYRARIEGSWEEVCRIDTAHGALHMHRFWLDPPDDIRILDKPVSRSDYGLDYDKAKAQLRRNWKRYRAKVEQRMKS